MNPESLGSCSGSRHLQGRGAARGGSRIPGRVRPGLSWRGAQQARGPRTARPFLVFSL